MDSLTIWIDASGSRNFSLILTSELKQDMFGNSQSLGHSLAA